MNGKIAPLPPNDDVSTWIRESGANLYRSTGDIQDNWNSIVNIVKCQIRLNQF